MWLRKCSTFVGDTSLRSVKSIVELTSRMGLHMAVVPVSLCQFWRGFVFFCFEHLDDKCRIVEESCVTQRGTCMNLSWFIIERLYVCRPTCQIMVLQISQNRSLWIRKKRAHFFLNRESQQKKSFVQYFQLESPFLNHGKSVNFYGFWPQWNHGSTNQNGRTAPMDSPGIPGSHGPNGLGRGVGDASIGKTQGGGETNAG